ncbi:MAG: hypothetical protein ACRD0V_06965 [Acidimicrobiales bacterium]
MLALLGAADALIERGNPAVHLRAARPAPNRQGSPVRPRARRHRLPVPPLRLPGRPRRSSNQRLDPAGITVERGRRVCWHAAVTGPCDLRPADSRRRAEHVTARYVVGCDGAHRVRSRRHGIPERRPPADVRAS